MKHVSDVTNGLKPQEALAKIPVVEPIKVDEQTASLVNLVFVKLQGIFPAWRQAWPNDLALQSAKREWIAGFVQGAINSDAQLAFGFQEARKSAKDFIPSVGTFIAWCTPGPAHFGMPSEANAWVEALIGAYTHEAVRIAAEQTGIFDLRQAKQDDKPLRQRFERNYAVVLRRAQTGLPLAGSIAKAISHDSVKSAEQVQHEFSERQLRERIAQQGIPTSGAAARAQLMAKLHIRRDTHA